MSYEEGVLSVLVILLLAAMAVPATLQRQGRMSKRIGTIWVCSAVMLFFLVLYAFVFWGYWLDLLVWTVVTEAGIVAAFAIGFARIGLLEYGDPLAYHRLVFTGRKPAVPSRFGEPE